MKTGASPQTGPLGSLQGGSVRTRGVCPLTRCPRAPVGTGPESGVTSSLRRPGDPSGGRPLGRREVDGVEVLSNLYENGPSPSDLVIATFRGRNHLCTPAPSKVSAPQDDRYRNSLGTSTVPQTTLNSYTQGPLDPLPRLRILDILTLEVPSSVGEEYRECWASGKWDPRPTVTVVGPCAQGIPRALGGKGRGHPEGKEVVVTGEREGLYTGTLGKC